MEDALRSLGLALFTCLALASCSTQRQTVGTAAGVATGAVVAGPVGAVVGGRSRGRPGLLLLQEPLGAAGAGSMLIGVGQRLGGQNKAPRADEGEAARGSLADAPAS